MQQQPDSDHVDVAVLVALDSELDAVLSSIGSWERQQFADDIRTYYRAVTPAGLSVVAARSSGMGQLNAALLVRDIVTHFRPSKVMLVGIAGGIGDKVKLGDIVISDQVVDYELAKVTKGGTSPRWSVHRSDALLRERLVDYRDKSWFKVVKVPRPDRKSSRVPQVHSGVVLSGNKVIADARAAGALASIWTRATAIEMEASGIAAALHQAVEVPGFVMIKAICDHADSKKNDAWQPYAAAVAAAFALSFVFGEMKPDAARKSSKERPLPPATAGVDMRALRLSLSAAFDLSELRILVSDLGFDWENIAGKIKDEKIVELLSFMNRRGEMARLIALVEFERPNLLGTFSPTL